MIKRGDKILGINTNRSGSYKTGIYTVTEVFDTVFITSSNPGGFHFENTLNHNCKWYPLGICFNYLWKKYELPRKIQRIKR